MTDIPASGPPSQDPDAGWRHMHPLTPLLRTGIISLAIIAGILANSQDFIRGTIEAYLRKRNESGMWLLSWLREHPLLALAIIGGLILIVGAVAALNWLGWKYTMFLLDDEGVFLRSGVISKKHRSARLDRVQAIDVDQPLLARLAGLATLTFDVAGGKNSNIKIGYLKRNDAIALRDAMLERVRVVKAGEQHAQPSAAQGDAGERPVAASPAMPVGPASPGSTADATPRTGAPLGTRMLHSLGATGRSVVDDIEETLRETLAPYTVSPRLDTERRLLRIAPHQVLLSRLLSLDFIILALLVLAIVVAVVLSIVFTSSETVGAILGGGLTAVITVGSIVLAQVKKAILHCNFTVALTVDGLTITTGLTTTVRRVVPLDRIQAVRLRQPILWRKPGWWAVEYNFAGGGEADGKGIGNVLLPVGSLAQALTLLGLALPEPGHPDAGRLLRCAMWGDNEDADSAALGLNPVPGNARWLDPLTAGRNAWTLTDTLLVHRDGRLVRRVDCVPHARVQSIARTQGPLQRRLGLATVGVHSTEGPIKPRLEHLNAGVAERLLFELADVTRRAREELDGIAGEQH